LSPSKLESFLRSFQADTHLREFQEPVREELTEVDGSIAEFFSSPIPLVQGISRHLLTVTGKKYRPTILLLVSHQGVPRREDAIFAATVIELIHTATLIHDDSIDQSAIRRGLPTINALYNDLVSTILGDYIYTKAFHELLQRNHATLVPVVARTAYRMSIGELLQLEQKNDLDLTEEAYFQLVDEKTASLMSAASEMGARVGNLEEERVQRYRRFGEALGRAYQVTDDLFDYLGNAAEMGKGVQSDLTEGKVTLPLIHAMGHASTRDRARLREMAAKKSLSPEEWTQLLGILQATGASEYCKEKALELAEFAIGQLQDEPDTPWRTALERAVAYAVHRNH
jgi:octaprenyl-diphosphate synthase